MEGAIRIDRPGYRYHSSKAVQVVASSTAPVYFLIGGQVLKSETTLVCDLSRNGIDVGSVAAATVYYLFAVNVNDAPILVCSVRPPTSGPVSFDSWTYLGAFATDASKEINPFVSCGGLFMWNTGATAFDVSVTNGSPATAKALIIPTTARCVYCRSSWATVQTVGNGLFVGSSTADVLTIHRGTSTTVSQVSPSFWWRPIQEEQTIYAYVTDGTAPTDNATIRVVGWIENPKEFI